LHAQSMWGQVLTPRASPQCDRLELSLQLPAKPRVRCCAFLRNHRTLSCTRCAIPVWARRAGSDSIGPWRSESHRLGKAVSALRAPVTNHPVTASANTSESAPWRATAAYLYVLQLDGPSLAWEYLRRNDAYQRNWQERSSNGHDAASRWGLRVLEDPQLDARAATPPWLAEEPVTPRSTPPVRESLETDALDVWKRASSRRLLHDGQRVLMLRRSRSPAAICASPRAIAHLRALQALDGLLEGASHREIAIALFGPERVRTQWLPDSALRAQVRRDLQRARAYSSGKYRALLCQVVVTASASKSSLMFPSQPDQTHCQRRGPALPARVAIEPDPMPSEPITRVPPRYVTADEAAEFLRLSPRTLEKHRGIGGGPRYHKFGRAVRYAMSDLEAWAEARAFEMTSDPDYPVLPAT